MTTERPEWTNDASSDQLWVEDDATVNEPNHETLARAWRRLSNRDLPERASESYDDGVSMYNLYPSGIITINSGVGYGEIRLLHPRRTDEAPTPTPVAEEVIDLSEIVRAPLTGDTFETFANFFIITAVSQLGQDTVARVFGEKKKVEKAEICLTVNGVQLPFLAILRRFHEQWERITSAEALRLLEEKFSSGTSDIFNLLDELKQKLEEAVGKKEE
jgi:hypothetical protein